MKRIIQRPTIFLILGIIIISLGLPFGIFGISLSGGASLGGTLILIGVLIVRLQTKLDTFL